jgi:hypothetical protein
MILLIGDAVEPEVRRLTNQLRQLNLVERFFAEITARRIRRGSYSSVDDLEGAIYDHLVQHNTKPKPFVWSKTAEDIIARERHALDALDQIRGNR